MGTYLALGGWLRFADETDKERWLKERVDSSGFADWPDWLFGPAEADEVDQATIGQLWKKVVKHRSIGQVLVVEDATTLRFAASLEEGDGFVWGAGILAALRRAKAKGITYGSFAEGGDILAVEDGELRDVDDDAEAARAEKLPEFWAAFRRAPSLADLPPLPQKTSPKAKKKKDPPRAAVVVPKKKPKFERMKLGSNVDVLRLCRAPSGEIWAACGRGKLARMKKAEWTLVDTGSTETMFDLAFSGSRVWAVGSSGTLLCLEGKRWVEKISPAKNAISVFAEGDAIVLTTNDGAVWRSEDAGQTWREILNVGVGVGSLCRGSGDRLIAAGLYGVVIVSEDLGRSFRETRRGNDAGFGSVCIANGVAWVSGMDRIMKSDEAKTGELVYAGPKRARAAMYTGVSAAGAAVWTSLWGAIHRTLDGGETWEMALEKDENFSDVLAISEKEAIVAGDTGYCGRLTFA